MVIYVAFADQVLASVAHAANITQVHSIAKNLKEIIFVKNSFGLNVSFLQCQ